MIGVAFLIVIPEGFITLSESYKDHQLEAYSGLSLLAGFVLMILIERFSGNEVSHDHEHEDYEEVNLSDEEI